MKDVFFIIIICFLIMSCSINRKNYVKIDAEHQSITNEDTLNKTYHGIDITNYVYRTEDRYGVRLGNDTSIVNVVKKNMSELDIINNRNGIINFYIRINYDGTIDSINIIQNNLEKYENFKLTEEQEVIILNEIKNNIKFKIYEETKKYYFYVKKPIEFTYIIIGKNLLK